MKPSKKIKAATHSKPAPLIKCQLCGEVLKLTKWKKHLARFHDIICESGFHNYFCVLDTGIKIKGKCKCRLCGAIINPSEWKYHLTCSHNVGESPQFHQFFISVDTDIETVQKKWYNSGSSILHNVSCGTKVNGGPEAKIIFNATFSNRKNF